MDYRHVRATGATALALCALLAGSAAAQEACQEMSASPAHHVLPANADTVHWGYFSKSREPRLYVHSGDLVTLDTLTHHANDDAERMVKGDPGAESVFRWHEGGKGVDRRGAGPMDASVYGRGAGEGFGVHILTGPIHVCGAEPGDVLEVEILDLAPRPSGNPGSPARRSAAMPRRGGAFTTTT